MTDKGYHGHFAMMFIETADLALEVAGRNGILVLYGLLKYADYGTGKNAFPTIETLGKASGLRDTATRKAVSQLLRAGIITENEWHGRSKSYDVPFPNAYSAPSSTPSQSDTPTGDEGMGNAKGQGRAAPNDGYREPSTKSPIQTEEKKDLPFSSDAFAEAWSSWREHRVFIKKKMSPKAEALSLKKIEGLTEAQAIETIETAISAGWQGLFPKVNPAPSNLPGKNQGMDTFYTEARMHPSEGGTLVSSAPCKIESAADLERWIWKLEGFIPRMTKGRNLANAKTDIDQRAVRKLEEKECQRRLSAAFTFARRIGYEIDPHSRSVSDR